MNKSLLHYTWTSEDVAKALRYNVQHVRKLAAEGQLPAIKRRRQWMFSEPEILAYLRALTNDNNGTCTGTANEQRTAHTTKCALLR